MKTVIGVHFWERQARLCLCDADSVSVAAIDLPSDIKRLNIIANDFSIKKALEVIDKFIKEQMNISDYSLVICISDDTGLKEVQLLYKCALECGIDVIKTVTETMAMAYFSYVEYSLEGAVIMTFASPAKLGMTQYYLENGVITTEDTFIAGRWNGSNFTGPLFMSPVSRRFFDTTDAESVFYSGTLDRYIAFEQAIKGYAVTNHIPREFEMQMLDSQCVIEGIGFICGKLEGREAFQGLKEVEIISPYEVFLSVNGVMYPIADIDTVLPFEETLEIENYPESDKTYDEFVIYEKRGKSLIQVSDTKIPKDETEVFYHKLCKLTFTIDVNKRIRIFVKSAMVDKEMEIDILTRKDMDAEGGSSNLTVEDMILRFIPVIDDLEYACKYSKDKNDPYIQGIMKTYNKALKILEDNGVELVSGEGKEFDYNTQTAVAHVSDLNLPDNTVKQVMQSGYVFKGKVLRPASVIVAN